ncbi:MAG: DUF4129 domain-containing protein [Lewinellaceae bacterium]|nr:DUF4129 domain-containing protein [Lewinellaceae bacterium]
MKRYVSCFLSLLFLFLLPGGQAYAQAEPDRGVGLDKEKWEVLAGELDYSAPVQQEEVKKAPSVKEARGWSILLKVMAVLAAIGIIALILRYLLAGESVFSPKNRKFSGQLAINLEDVEAHLPDADMPEFIRRALQAGDYRMAVRLHYLSLIQGLTRRGWIEWKREKTNGDYLREIQERPVFGQFRELTGIFERVWYGDYPLEEGAYRQVAGHFADCERSINQTA